jgi:hypothetical protein
VEVSLSSDNTHGGNGTAQRHGRGGVDDGDLHGHHQLGAQPAVGHHHRHRGRSDQVRHPDRHDEFQATNGAHLTGPRWDRGRTGHLPTGGDRLHLHRHWDDRHLRQRLLPGRNQVKLDARPAQGLSFLGWEFETSCRDAPKVTVAAGVAHTCRPVFRVK